MACTDPTARWREDYLESPGLKETVMQYEIIGRAEMKPDVYDGPGCDQHKPQWWAHFHGDMDSDHSPDLIQLDPKHFPPGTKVTITCPCCPNCGLPADHQTPVCGCGFDWREWASNEYA